MRKKLSFIALSLIVLLTTVIFASCAEGVNLNGALEIELTNGFKTVYFEDEALDTTGVSLVWTSGATSVSLDIGKDAEVTGPAFSDLFAEDEEILSAVASYDVKYMGKTVSFDVTVYKRIENIDIFGADFTRNYFVYDDIAELNADTQIAVYFVGDYPSIIVPFDESYVDFEAIDTETAGTYPLNITVGYFAKQLGTIEIAYQPAPAYQLDVLEVSAESISLAATEGVVFGMLLEDETVLWQESNLFDGLRPNTQYTFYSKFDNHRLYGTTNPQTISANTAKRTYTQLPQLTLYQITKDSIGLYSEDISDLVYTIAVTGQEPTEVSPNVIDGIVWFEGLSQYTEYTISAYFAETDEYYKSESVEITVTTAKEAGEITFAGFSGEVRYNGYSRHGSIDVTNSLSLPKESFTVKALKNGVEVAFNNLINAGTYDIEITCENPLYDFTPYSTQITILPRLLRVETDAVSFIYNGNVQTADYSLVNVFGSDNAQVSADKPESVNVGEYGYTLSIANANYAFDAGHGEVNYAITERNISLSGFENKTVVYNGAAHSFGTELVNVVSGDTVNVAIIYNNDSNVSPINAGVYNAVASIGNSNYILETTQASITVTQKTASVSVENASKTYGEVNPAFIVEATGFIEELTFEVTTTATQYSDVGQYAIGITEQTLGNYDITYTNATLTITELEITVVFAGYEGLVYNGEIQTIAVNSDGAVNGDELGLTLSYSDDAISAGSYTATASISNGNYALTGETSIEFSIGKKAASVSVENAAKTYGEVNPSFIVKATGFIEDLTFIATTTATQYSDVGQYAIGITEQTLGNYDITYTNATLTITELEITVVFAGYDGLVYNGETRTVTVNSDGAINGDDLDLSISFDKTVKDAGSYTATAATANSNYTITNPTLSFDINKKTATVTVASTTKTYGDVNPEFTVEAAGFVESIGFVATTTAERYSVVGTYPVVITEQTLNNYEITYTNATLVISVRTITVDFSGYAGLTYNGEERKSQITVSSNGAVNGDNLSLTISYNSPEVKNAGSYIATAATANTNYTIGNPTQSFSIATKALTISAVSYSVTRLETVPEFEVSYNGFVGGESKLDLSGELVLTCDAEENEYQAGVYTIIPSGFTSSNYNIIYANGTLTITMLNITVSANNVTATYDGNVHTVNPIVRVDGEVIVLPLTIVYKSGSDVVGEPVNAGVYTVTIAFEGNDDYVETSTTCTVTINKLEIVVTATNTTKIYGETDKLGFTASEAVIGDVIGTISRTEGENVGSYTISFASTNENYTVTFTAATFYINEKTIEVTFGGYDELIYNGEVRTITVTSDGFVGGDVLADLSLSISYDKEVRNAGSYTATAATANTNYIIGNPALTFSIGKKAAAVSAENATKTYGEANPSFIVAATGFIEEFTFAATTTATQYSDVGQYAISITQQELGNYNITYTNATITITERVITITFTTPEFTYSGVKQEVIYGFVNVVNGDDVGEIIAYSAETINAGSYTATASIINGNYVLTGVTSIDFSIAKKAATVTYNNLSKTYGETDPSEWNYTATGFLAGTTDVTRTAGETVGIYNFTFTLTGENISNYNITFENGTVFEIVRRSVTITIDDISVVYGAEMAALTYTITSGNLIGNDDLNIELSVSGYSSNAGSYAINGVFENGNYDVEFIAGTYTITVITLTVTIDEKTGVYGESLKSLTYTLSGTLAGSDTIEITLTKAEGLDAGNYDITGGYTINGQSGNGNYAVIFNGADYIITPRSISVSLDNKSATYGDNLSVIELTFNIESGTLAAGDTEQGLFTLYKEDGIVFDGRNAGTYSIYASGLNPNYGITFINSATFTINKAELEIGVESATTSTFYIESGKFQFIFTYDGFVYDDTYEALTTLPRVDTSSLPNINTTIEIFPTGAEAANYNISYTKGHLTLEEMQEIFTYNRNLTLRVGTVNSFVLQTIELEYDVIFGFDVVAGKSNENSTAIFTQNGDGTYTVSFTGGGMAVITGTYNGTAIAPLNIEIIPQAYNATTSAHLGSTAYKIKCLQADIANSGQFSVAADCTVFGNGFSVSAYEGTYSSHNNNFVSLQGTIDNLRILNLYVSEVRYSSGQFYETSTTVSMSQNAKLLNSYVEYGKYGIRFFTGVQNCIVSNTTIVGGAYASVSVECTGAMILTFENITIVQVPYAGRNIGAGFLVDNGATASIVFRGQNNNFHTFMNQAISNQLTGDLKTMFNTLWNNAGFSKYRITIGDVEYMHYIMAVVNKTQYTSYDFSNSNLASIKVAKPSMSMLGYSGVLVIFDIDTDIATKQLLESYAENRHWLTVPQYCSNDYSALEVSAINVDMLERDILEESSPTIILNVIDLFDASFTKYGVELPYTLTVAPYVQGNNAELYLNAATGDVTVTGKNFFNVIYTVQDIFDLDQNGEPKEYTYTNRVEINVPVKAPEITIAAKNSGSLVFDLNTSGINNTVTPVDLTGVEFMKQTTRTGNMFDYNSVCEIQFLSDFVVTIKGFEDDETAVNLISGTNVTPGKGTVTLKRGGLTIGEAKRDTENSTDINTLNTKESLLSENRPGGSTDKSKRFFSVFEFTLEVEYNGKTATRTFKVAYWAPSVTSWG